MNINDHTIIPMSKVIIDFGTVDEEEYKVLCATSYNYQGVAAPTNYSYVQTRKPWWMLFKKSDYFIRARKTAAFEFPNQECVDIWLKEVSNYFVGE